MKKNQRSTRNFQTFLKQKGAPTHDDHRATINTIISSLEKIKTLPEEYKQKTSSRFFVNQARNRAIELILSLANECNIQQPSEKQKTPSALNHLRKQASSSSHALRVVQGACLNVFLDIKASYDNAWISKNPDSSELYKTIKDLLSEQLELKPEEIGTVTEKKQAAALTALQSFLEQANADKVYGGKTAAELLNNLTQQLQQPQAPETTLKQ